jgi:hypothetical protein
LGRFPADAKIAMPLNAFDARLFAIVPAAADNRPVLLSTSRHVSQGGLDLEQLDWKKDGQKWVATGRSGHLVKGDAYEMAFYLGGYQLASASAKAGQTSIRQKDQVGWMVIDPAESGETDWQIVFEPAPGTT